MAEQRNDSTNDGLDVFDPKPADEDFNPRPEATVYTNSGDPDKPGLIARIFGKKKQDPNAPDLRGGVLNPFAKRDQAIHSLTRGFDQLTDLMQGIQVSMEKSTEKQSELIDTLKHLPASVEQAAEANKIHGETLLAIKDQIGNQTEHQEKLGAILDTIGQTGEAQRKGLDTLQERVEAMREADAQMAENLSGVGQTMHGLGDAMRAVSDSSARSNEVLEQLRSHLDKKTDHLEEQMRKQSKWFSFLLGMALFLSFLALLFVAGMGYFVVQELRDEQPVITEENAAAAPGDIEAVTGEFGAAEELVEDTQAEIEELIDDVTEQPASEMTPDDTPIPN
ncbi:MAG: hypothetical protein AAGD32_02595 [Planctomycetota bacterium]